MRKRTLVTPLLSCVLYAAATAGALAAEANELLLSDLVTKLEAAEARVADFAFEIEAKTSAVERDGVTGGWHLKVLYDGSPYRRYYLDLFSEVGPWPDDPSGAGIAVAALS